MSESILRFNSLILYLLGAALVALLIFFMLRNHLRLQGIARRSGFKEFDDLNRAGRQARVKDLLFHYPGLSRGMTWLNERLLQARRSVTVTVTLAQEWCCEDHAGTAEVPCRCRPCSLDLCIDGQTETFPLKAFGPEQFLTPEENKLLSWALLERCRALLPYRRCRTRIRRVTRRFRVENGVPVQWRDDTAIMEEYTVEVL